MVERGWAVASPRDREILTLKNGGKYITKANEGRAHGLGMASGNGKPATFAGRAHS
jgi:hypothetical protein